MFEESKEGAVYMRLKHHDKVANSIISTIKGPSGDPQKWMLKVRKEQRRFKNRNG